MNRRLRFVALVCIAVFAFAAITAAPVLALLDAHTPVQALFGIVHPAEPLAPSDVLLPAAPVVDIRAPRPPPRLQPL